LDMILILWRFRAGSRTHQPPLLSLVPAPLSIVDTSVDDILTQLEPQCEALEVEVDVEVKSMHDTLWSI
jgi:hypothetical protein